MKTTPIRKKIYNEYYNSFPKKLANPKPKEVWLALFPYKQLGNMEKIRPVYILNVDHDNNIVQCQKITTNPEFARKIKGKLSNIKPFNRDSYLNNEKTTIPIYKLFSRLKNKIELEDETNE